MSLIELRHVSKRFGRLVGSGPTPIERLVGIAIASVGYDALGALVGSGKLTEVQAKSLTTLLDALPPEPSVAEGIDISDRWTQLDAVLRRLDHPERVEFFELDPMPVASRDLRTLLEAGAEVNGDIPEETLAIIRDEGLYTR